MKIIKYLFAFILAFSLFTPVQASSEYEWVEQDYFKSFTNETESFGEDYFFTYDDELITIIRQNNNIKVMKYAANGDILNELSLKKKDAAFLVNNPIDNSLNILFVDYEKAQLRVYDEDFKLQRSQSLAIDKVAPEYEDNISPYFAIRHFSEDTFTILYIEAHSGMGPYYPTQSFHFKYNGQSVSRDQLNIQDEVRWLRGDYDSNNENAWVAELITQDYQEIDKTISFELDANVEFMAEAEAPYGKSTEDYYYITIPGFDSNTVVIIDRKTNKVLDLPSDYTRGYSLVDRGLVILTNDKGYRVYDVNKRAVVKEQALPNISYYNSETNSFAINYEEKAYLDQAFNVLVTVPDSYGATIFNDQTFAKSNSEGTIISNIATGEKIAELPYKYANYVMDPTGNFLIMHSWDDGYAVLKKSSTSITEPTYPVNKAWTITFSSDVDEKTLTPGSISVVNQKGDSIGIQKEIDGNKIIVRPLDEYTPGKYTLHIKPNFKSVNGMSLEEGATKEFIIKN